MIEKITLIHDYIDVDTHITVHKSEDGLGNLVFDYAEITSECKGKIRLTLGDLMSLKRILTSKELDL